jgi:hypothetical protein
LKLRELLKMKPVHPPEEAPKFIRDHMKVDDINGAKSRQMYRGVAKDILSVRDIEGTKPLYEKVSLNFH